ncbi:MAG: hypothetical protein GC191_07755 [Azospirillum sp.]|nr:hypothetical protein [Azospirillum sp.]
MARLVLALALLFATPAPSHAGADLARDLGQACVFGATLFGTAAVLTGSASLAAGVGATTLLPAGVASAAVGCGLIVISELAGRLFGQLYDGLTWRRLPRSLPVTPGFAPRHQDRA